MDTIRLGPFLGANKALEPKLLPPNVGVESLNQYPDRGDLRPWNVPLAVGTAPGGTKTLYMLGRDATTDTIYWFVWSTIVHAVRSFIADDTTKRTYFTGSGAPKVTDNLIGLAGAPYPTSYRDLGIPKPLTAPIITETAAGTGDDEERFYAYAYVSDWGEIGQPIVSGVVTCKPGALFDITNLAAPPTGAGENRGITTIRIWRTVASTVGDFFFLRDVALPATASTDDARAVGTDTMPSAFWLMPPADLKNLIGLWNEIMAGISGNSVRYCESGKPYAWPAAYETLCLDTPVALGVFEQKLVIATTGRPRLVQGTAPEAMDDSPIEFLAACVSAQSMVSMGHGVCWAAADGLAYVGTNGAPRLLTAACMLLEDWKALNPETIIGGQFGGRYFGFYLVDGVRKGFIVDPLAPDTIRFLSAGYSSVFFDPLEEQLYVLSGTSIQRWNAGATPMTVLHRSKVFRLPKPDNPACAEVIADGYPVTFKLWAGVHSKAGWSAGALRMTKTVTSREPFWLPSGYLADDLQVELSGTFSTAGAVIADSIEALAQT